MSETPIAGTENVILIALGASDQRELNLLTLKKISKL
jgi:hypothetical protein